MLSNVDAIVIAAPATHHCALAIEAIDSGRHLLVEKPLAVTSAEAKALTDRARNKGVFLQVGHQERYVCEAAGLFGEQIRRHLFGPINQLLIDQPRAGLVGGVGQRRGVLQTDPWSPESIRLRKREMRSFVAGALSPA